MTKNVNNIEIKCQLHTIFAACIMPIWNEKLNKSAIVALLQKILLIFQSLIIYF